MRRLDKHVVTGGVSYPIMVQIDPTDAYAHFNLGVLQLVSGDETAAFLTEALKKAGALG